MLTMHHLHVDHDHFPPPTSQNPSLTLSTLSFDGATHAINPDFTSMPTGDLTVEFWAQTPRLGAREGMGGGGGGGGDPQPRNVFVSYATRVHGACVGVFWGGGGAQNTRKTPHTYTMHYPPPTPIPPKCLHPPLTQIPTASGTPTTDSYFASDALCIEKDTHGSYSMRTAEKGPPLGPATTGRAPRSALVVHVNSNGKGYAQRHTNFVVFPVDWYVQVKEEWLCGVGSVGDTACTHSTCNTHTILSHTARNTTTEIAHGAPHCT